jgi:ATP-dependent Clp protease ATP-binding subunit ClpC
VLEAKVLKTDLIGTEHLMLSILKNTDNIATQILGNHDVDYSIFKDELEFMSSSSESDFRNEFADENTDDSFERGGTRGGGDAAQKGKPKSKTPVLDNFGRDVTDLAEQGKLDPIVGRETEIERVSQILSRRKKNNPILIGEPGVGKTAIVEGLAERIINKKVSRVLFNKRVIMLDLAALVAGTKYRGQFD